jgi:pimeloyl-ACP methyl ester carboxylesterase
MSDVVSLPDVELERWSWVRSDGTELTGWRTPQQDGTKPVLVFLHGNGFAQKIYLPLFAELVEHVDLVLPEQASHGEAPQTDHFMGWNGSANLVADYLNAQSGNWKNWVLSGHSFGGILSFLAADKLQFPPQCLVLLDPIILPRRVVWMTRIQQLLGLTRFHPMVSITRNRTRRFESREQAFEKFSGRGVFKGWTDQALWSYVNASLTPTKDGGVALITDPKRECEIFGSYAWGLRKKIKAIDINTLVLLGNKTFPFQQQAVKQAAGTNRHLHVELLEGGHCFMQEIPRETASRLLSFIKK